jgi:hypothetical protein
MRSCGLLLWLVACTGGPTLAVSVHERTGYGVVRTQLTVYAGDAATCAAIEFGDRTAEELAALTTEEVDVTRGGAIDVARRGPKAIVARGFDKTDRPVTAGCDELGDLNGATQLTIETQPTAVVAIDPDRAERPFAERTILVNVADVNGKPFDTKLVGADAIVSWQLTGPAGAVDPPPAAGMALSANGDAKIHVADLGTPGPEALRIRAPWATSALPLLTAFDLSRASLPIPLGGGAVPARVACDVRGHAGKPPTLVCLTEATVAGHRDVIELGWQGSAFTGTPLTIPPTINDEFALFVDRDGSADEPVYVVGGSGATGVWYKLGAPAASATSFPLGGALANLVYIPRCKANATTALVAVTSGVGPTSTAYYLPSGAAAGLAPTGEMYAGGCVADVDKQEHQAVVTVGPFGTPPSPTAALFVVQGGVLTAVTATKLTGSGFIATSNQGVAETRFAGTRVQASGVVVVQAVLALEGQSYRLVERSELAAAGAPTKILAGKLDQDADTDLIWDIAVGRQRLFQMALAKQASGAPMTALTSGPNASLAGTAVIPADFFVADLNGHGTDELIVVTGTSATVYAPD